MDMLKSELRELAKKKNKPEPQYIYDRMALENDFVVACLLLDRCMFNPIELIWAWIKREVAKENKTFKITDDMALKNEAISAVTANQWHNACLHCKILVDEFWKTDCLQEEYVEQFLIDVNGDDGENDKDDDSSDEDVFVEQITQ